ncbi:cations transporter [[Clostridium] sordellii]|uniref:magnesium transporter CorA family protein n=1 Tax=Paraclostridium sordellii TaxID=1505 RepID=UPI000543AC87|nr:magnesium transporter CorA family protein [Paeniclostridium sordellii]CEK30223.1 cations transporter [[Clostridium] sordellii] [Paeniclostridium sordellii]
MIRYYKTIDSKLEKLKSFENGCWINLVEPTTAEILDISTKFNIDIESIRAALDEEERSRIDIADNHILILIDIPIDESDASSAHYSTIPLGIILLDNTIVTICTAQTKILNDFIVGHVKNFFTFKKTRFILQILYKNASYYLHYLRRINKMTIAIEKEIYKSMKNKELVQLLELEKSLIYFSTSLKANELVLNKMLRTESIKKYSEDEDLLEDVIIENKQALEMATIYGDILSRIMDAFSAIVSNNQNTVMQFLTSITLIMSIPTIVSGFFGMNVEGLPFSNHVNGFWIVILITCIMCLILTFIMSRNKLL